MGFEPMAILSVQTYCFLFNFLQHTTVIPKLGILEEVLNTPSHHRVHHGSNPMYVNKNYGNTLILFDRLFGTFEREAEPPVYGLTENPTNRNFIYLIFHEWIALFRRTYVKLKLKSPFKKS
ncbi:MAG: sterol desaturase family protein [Saprospiraceae bacterium]|nr:sterol desaturase family protein [Saprospiraceae bacterium]MCB9325575.1 sterol desaturase family protein [Lewinellaceae bacterium]